MDLKEIITVTGRPGLYKIVSKAKNNIIVESLFETNKRIPVYPSDKMNNMEDISIFTNDADVSLKSIFKSIFEKENGGPSINHKADEKSLRAYFEEILPDYDRDRVYVSDIRKLFNWYNILQSQNILDFTEQAEEAVTEEGSETAAPEVKEKPVKKSAATAENKALKPKKDSVNKKK